MEGSIYRFKLSEGINEGISAFARLHRFDDRTSYKEAWKDWLDANQELVDSEARRLRESGYNGDVSDKLFKSGRYYYRTRPFVVPPPAQRRQYTRVRNCFIQSVDQHVNMHFDNPEVSPSAGFEDFCRTCAVDLAGEVEFLTSAGLRDPEEISEKLKKCYKNRYFMRREAGLRKHS